jgi:hypothetical protein
MQGKEELMLPLSGNVEITQIENNIDEEIKRAILIYGDSLTQTIRSNLDFPGRRKLDGREEEIALLGVSMRDLEEIKSGLEYEKTEINEFYYIIGEKQNIFAVDPLGIKNKLFFRHLSDLVFGIESDYTTTLIFFTTLIVFDADDKGYNDNNVAVGIVNSGTDTDIKIANLLSFVSSLHSEKEEREGAKEGAKEYLNFIVLKTVVPDLGKNEGLGESIGKIKEIMEGLKKNAEELKTGLDKAGKLHFDSKKMIENVKAEYEKLKSESKDKNRK